MGLVFVWKCAISPRLKCVAAWILMQWSVLSISMLPSHSQQITLRCIKATAKIPQIFTIYRCILFTLYTMATSWLDWTRYSHYTIWQVFITVLNSWKPQGTKQFSWNLAQCRLWTDFKLTPETPWSFRKILVTLKAENSSENNTVFMSLCY